MVRSAFLASTAAALLLGAYPAVAQDGTSATSTAQARPQPDLILSSRRPELLNKFKIDTSIPEAAGFSAIGVSPTDVLDPGVSRSTFASLLNYLDEEGNLKPGFALGGTPYWWIPNRSLSDYRNDSTTTDLERILARTEISAAYASGDASTARRLGLGFSTELFGSSDYRLNDELYACSDAAIEAAYGRVLSAAGPSLGNHAQRAAADWDAWRSGGAALASIDPGDAGILQLVATDPDEARDLWIVARTTYLNRTETTAAVNAAREENDAFLASMKECQDRATHIFAGRQSLTVSGGLALREDPGSGDSYDSDGGSLWVVYRRPFALLGTEAPNYLGVFARHDFDKSEEVTPGVTQSFEKSTLAAVVGYEQGASKLSLQAGWETVDFDTGPQIDDEYLFYTLSYDYRIAPNVWVTLRGGSRGDQKSVTEKNDEYFLLSLKWGSGTE